LSHDRAVIDTRTSAIARVLLAAGLFGSTGVVVETASVAAAPATLGAARLLIGGAALTWWTARRPASHTSECTSSVSSVDATSRHLAIAVLAIVGYQLLVVASVVRTGAGVAAVVSIGSGPVWAGILDLVAGRRPSTRWWGTTALTIAGLWVLIGADGGAVDPAGVACALCAGWGWTTFTRRSALMVAEGRSPGWVASRVFFLAGAVLSPLLVVHAHELLDVRVVTVCAYLGIVTVAVAYRGYVHALEHLRARDVVSLTLAEPFAALLLSAVVASVRI
jgi:DME family drug/metabolite transporter